jgi:hypothetical protein
VKPLECWLPPDGAGKAIACLATSFTFDAVFFAEDCLSRFLSLSTRDPDGASGLDIAGLLEEEERLSEARVVVLVDQTCRPGPRNLRWDLLPVRVNGGLLHAKVAILVWERLVRVVIGSANLTPAGYRNQVETVLAIDVDGDCRFPRSIFDTLGVELRRIVDLAPGQPQRPGPANRARQVLDEFSRRVADVDLPSALPSGFRAALAPAGPGTNPLDGFNAVWSGSPPQAVLAMSPFWDDTEDMPGAREVLRRLARRASTKGNKTKATFVVPVDNLGGVRIALAPRRLGSIAEQRIETKVCAFKGEPHRRLHAKVVQYRSDHWLATMFGSSNLTAKGLGLDARAHRELNLWLGCRADSPAAKALEALVPTGDEIDSSWQWGEPEEDEEESETDLLPVAFDDALLVGRRQIELGFSGKPMPETWAVCMEPAGSATHTLLDAAAWRVAREPRRWVVELPGDGDSIPSYLDVRWMAGGRQRSAAWFVNIADGALLPPPSDLRDLDAKVLLEILASTRPLRAAIDAALSASRKPEREPNGEELDPLKRFDSAGLLVQRSRRTSAALWGIERRLSQPLPGAEALEWRLAGTLGPEHLARKLIESRSDMLAGELHFLIAEIALTVHRVPWDVIRGSVPLGQVRERVGQTQALLKAVLDDLGEDDASPPILGYVSAALAEVAR